MGTIFKTDGSGNNATLQYDFENTTGGLPQGSFIQATDGKLYGLTTIGALSYGVLFQVDPVTNTYTKKINFNDTNGDTPKGSLMQATDGKLYGMTFYGGNSALGVIFQYNPVTNVLTKKVDFNNTNGSHPAGELIQATDGKLYGMTKDGGINGKGVLFQYDPITNIYVKKIDFATSATGSNPLGSLKQASDGKMYGMTFAGGANNFGVIFQYDPVTNTLTKKFDFPTSVEGSPIGSLSLAANGKLYGMTQNNLFQYDFINNIYTQKVYFDASYGNCRGNLIQATDGNLYGMTSNKIFQYNQTTDVLTIQFTFPGVTGIGWDIYGSLIEISSTLNTTENQFSKNLKIYPNPTNGNFNIEVNEEELGAKVLVYNIIGQNIKTFKLDNLNTKQSLDSGMYILEIEKDGNKINRKLIVK